MKIKNLIPTLTFALVVLFHTNAFAQDTKMVGGAEMYPTKDIVSNAVNSKDHTTLVAAVKAADLVETLQGDGPFTVFAPQIVHLKNYLKAQFLHYLKKKIKRNYKQY